ncbi:MAG TPA: ABC transporter permease [Lacunisphaera sp.]|jgi:lipopolysaccharide transport system permease protein
MSQSSSSAPALSRPFTFLHSLHRHRSLLWQFTLRNIELRHKGSHLGLIWSLLNPLLMLGLYVFVFGYIFNGKFNGVADETKVDYVLALFLGLTIFQLFTEVLAIAPTVIVTQPNFVKKVVFPLEIIPAASVGAALFHMLMSLILVLAGVAFLGPGLNAKIVWLPLILLSLIPLALGASWFLSAVGVFFRDIAQVIGFVSMALLYASAVFFPPSIVPAALWKFLRFNPLLLAVDLSRNAVMWDHPVNLAHLGYLMAVSLMICCGGYWCFKKLAPAFADVL